MEKKTDENKPETEMTEEQLKMFFDEKLTKMSKDLAQEAFLKVPELRSFIVVYDYYRNLNDADGITKGLWLHRDGKADKPVDSILGSTGAMIQALAHMLDDLMRKHAEVLQQLTQASQEILDLKTRADK